MPRGKKKAVPVEPVPVQEAVEVKELPASKTRKAYPTYSERIAAADRQIERLQKLNASREALIAQTEQKLNERKDALAKSVALLEKTVAKRVKLVEAQNKPPKAVAAKSAKASEKKQYEELLAVLSANGKSIDDLLQELKA